MSTDLTILILTFNEEKNLPECLASLNGIEAKILAVDSFSTDSTLEILKKHEIPFLQHEFGNYSLQRNWAQQQIKTEWVLHIDADERLTPEFVTWYNKSFKELSHNASGFMFSRKTMFMNRWIRFGGHYPNFHLRLFKTSFVKCEEKAYDQHFIQCAPGNIDVIKHADIINVVSESLSAFTAQHNKWATSEANEIFYSKKVDGEVVSAKFFGTPIERRRWLKTKLFMKSPLFVRPVAYFIYRYFFRFGFLDGTPGLIFHFLQGFWFRFLVDAKVYELIQSNPSKK
ncbi:MAG: glycosyltransferase family 2 protein [Bacteroidetes bacterium]|nr:glycosyltransferase family 2 protein [Bacteroidota bacterium]